MYQDYDSDSDVPEELKQDYVDEQTGDVPHKRSVPNQIVFPNCTALGMTRQRTWFIQVSIISTLRYFRFVKVSEHVQTKNVNHK